MNVKCIKDNTDMVPHDNNIFVCLKCENRVQIAFGKEDLGTLEKVGYEVFEGAKMYDDI